MLHLTMTSLSTEAMGGGLSAPLSYNAIIAPDSSTPAAGQPTWAAWMASRHSAPILRLGICHGIRHSTGAELQAIRFALSEADGLGLLSGHVLLMSDSLMALAEILRGVPGCIWDGTGMPIPALSSTRMVRPNHRPRLQAIRRIVRGREMVLALRHVRGHTPGAGNWANHAADILARALSGAIRGNSG